MNKHIKKYLKKYGIKDNPDWSTIKAEKMRNDDSYFYAIVDFGTYDQDYYIKERSPKNDKEDLVIDYLKTLNHY